MALAETITLFSESYLKKLIFENSFVYFDIWSILHLTLFFFIGKFTKTFDKINFKIVLIVMVLFELFEFFMSKTTIFFDETLKDQITDLLVNTAGYFFGKLK